MLFDLDGTLADSLPLIRYSFEKVFAHLGIPWDNGRVMETVGLPLRQVAKDYAGERAEEFLKLYLEYQLAVHDQQIKLFPGTMAALEQVGAWGLKTAVVTSKRRKMAQRALQHLAIGHKIDLLVAMEDCAAHKPDPLPVLTALEQLGVPAKGAVFVGDSWYDVISGNGAGVATIAVTWGMADRRQLSRANPDQIADRWEEVLTFINDRISRQAV